jgi:hypothetical protein
MEGHMVPHFSPRARQLSHWMIVLVVIGLSALRAATAAPAAEQAQAVEHLIHTVTYSIPSPNFLDGFQSVVMTYLYKTSACLQPTPPPHFFGLLPVV